MEAEIIHDLVEKPLDNLSALLSKFKELPELEFPERTFMEISGYPHFENVCSNILAFYFDPNEIHNFKDLFLKSLISALYLDEIGSTNSSVISVNREEVTKANKRIDLVITGSEFVIAIENKIYAGLYNDLKAYSNHIEEVYSNLPNKIKVVLSLNSINDQNLAGGFLNLTYNKFVDQLKINIGSYLLTANSKYVTHLTDFILTIQNLNVMTEISPKVSNFFINNKVEIDNLIAEDKKIKQFLSGRIKVLKSMIESQPKNITQWIWMGNCLVHDILLPDGTKAAIDCYLQLDGFKIELFLRDNSDPLQFLRRTKLYDSKEIYLKNVYGTRIVLFNNKDLPFDSQLESVGNKLNVILKGIQFFDHAI